MRYEHYYNHRYHYDLVPMQDVSPPPEGYQHIHRLPQNARPTKFWLTICIISADRAAYWPSAFTTPSQVLQTDSGMHYVRDKSQAPSLPQVGTDVTIVEDYDHFIGTMISVNGKVVIMKVFQYKVIGIIILNNRRGMFIFSNPGAIFVTVKEAVQQLMTFIGDSWLKNLLSSHDNNTIRLTNLPLLTDKWLNKFLPLNQNQTLALARATDVGPTLYQNMKVFRNKGIGSIVLSIRSGRFIFNNPGAAFVSIKKAVQKVLTFIGQGISVP